MLSISSGHSSTYLTEAVAVGRENYYTGAVAAGEPPGRWYGTGADQLGLVGLVDHQDMTAVFEHFLDPRDPRFRTPAAWAGADTLGHAGRRYRTPDEIYAGLLSGEPDATPERREELRTEAGQKARQNVAFHDVTFSVQKSITVLHAAFEAQQIAATKAGDVEAAQAWGAHRQAVENAIWAGNRAALDYLAKKAGYSRIGHHGGAAGRFVDAHDWVIASFFQHDNRNGDPQLHIHNAVLNRAPGTDGEWRTLDGGALYLHRNAAAAVGERTTEEHLSRALGVRFALRPDGKAREIVGIRQQVLDLFSTRRRAVTAKTAQLVAVFEASYGRAPNALQLDRLQRQATLATRKAKSHTGETDAERLARWEAELRAEVSGGLGEVAHDALNATHPAAGGERWSPTDVIETALAEVQGRRQSWTRPDLARAINTALPDYLGGLDADQVARLVDTLADQALERGAVLLTADGPATASLPDQLRLADGQTAYSRPGSIRYATSGHLRAERGLRAAAAETGAPSATAAAATGFVQTLAAEGIELGADQAAALRGILCSGARVEALVGPAGTGKSFVIGALARAWTDPTVWDGRARRVVGLASSQIATENLAGEGLPARNITQWLAAQQRLTTGRHLADDHAWQLAAGDMVVVDESAMTSTADLTAIRDHVDRAGAKLLLTGDHRQLAAVGAGGGMGLVAEAGSRHELAEVRRFTHSWEADASLRLRERGLEALAEYRKHGRIVDGGTTEHAEDQAREAFLADTLAGRGSLLIVDTNDQAAAVSAKVRAELVRLGRVAEHGVPLGRDGTTAGVGDVVQARRNEWQLAGHDGNRRGPINRELHRVLEIRDDGSLVVAPLTSRTSGGDQLGGRITLPPTYVEQHLVLGYATTVYSAQGLTVDTSHAVATGHTSASALYVELSRGRDTNTVYVTTHNLPADHPAGAGSDTACRDPLAVLHDILELGDDGHAAVIEAEHSAQEASSVKTAGERFTDAVEVATAGRAAACLDRLVAGGLLTARERERLAGEDGMESLARLMRRAEVAGHDPHTVLAAAIGRAPLTGARSISDVLHARITQTTPLEPVGESYPDWIPAVDDPAWRAHLTDLAASADDRRRVLGAEVAGARPQWAVEALGPVSDTPEERLEWEHRAGIVAAHRELTGHDDQTTALPGPPKPGQVEAYASWRAAWRALGRPEAQRAEAEMSDGQLRARTRAYQRERAWEPAYVAQELSGTTQAEARYRHLAELRAAEVDAADPADVPRLQAEADQAAALADQLAQQREQLEHADHVRALWYAHTAETRAAAQRAADELTTRGVAANQLDDHNSTEEWLDAHTQAQRVDDAHRQITDETELHDVATSRDEEVATAFPAPTADSVAPAPVDIREATADTPPDDGPETEDWTRIPTPDETAQAVERARRAMAELQQRRAHDERRATEDAHTRQIAHWQARDRDAATEDRDVPALTSPLD